MNDTARTPEEDEFEHAGLTKLASERIRPPRAGGDRHDGARRRHRARRCRRWQRSRHRQLSWCTLPIESSMARADQSELQGGATAATGTPTPPTCSDSPDRPDGDQHGGSRRVVSRRRRGGDGGQWPTEPGEGVDQPHHEPLVLRSSTPAAVDCLDGRPCAGHAGPADAHRRRPPSGPCRRCSRCAGRHLPGRLQQALINRAIEAVLDGSKPAALIVGGETKRRDDLARRAESSCRCRRVRAR